MRKGEICFSPIVRQWEGHKTDLTLGHRSRKSDIQVLQLLMVL